MTMTANENETENGSEGSQNGNGQAPGSPRKPEENNSQTTEEETTSGSEEEVSSEGQGEENSSQALELRRKVTEQGEQLAGYQDLVQIASQHPDWTMKQVFAYVQTGQEPSTESDDTDPYEDLYEPLVGKNEEGRKAFKELTARITAMTEKRLLGKLSPVLNKTFQAEAEDKFSRGLRKSGIDPELAADDEDFNRFQADYLRENKSWFSAVQKADPIKAGQFMGEAYSKKLGNRNSLKTQAKDLQFRRDAMLEEKGSKGKAAQVAANTVTLPRNADMHAIRKVLAAGKKIKFEG